MQGNALKDAGQVEEAIACYQVWNHGMIYCCMSVAMTAF
jgi:hypothetical protein